MSITNGIGLVVTDLDGTLWDAGERIHARTLEALRELEAREIPLLVATGRGPRSAAAGLAREGLTPPAILLDGAMGQDLSTGEFFHRTAFSPADASAVLAAFTEAGLSPCVYVSRDNADVAVGPDPSTHPEHLLRIGDWLAHEDLGRLVADEPVHGFGLAGQDCQRVAGMPDAVQGIAEAVVTRDLYLGGHSLIVRPPGVSKWHGVLAFCEQRDLDPGRVLALGDGDNDVELLAGASVACVVSDGCAAALALADHVIEPASAGGWCAVLDLC